MNVHVSFRSSLWPSLPVWLDYIGVRCCIDDVRIVCERMFSRLRNNTYRCSTSMTRQVANWQLQKRILSCWLQRWLHCEQVFLNVVVLDSRMTCVRMVSPVQYHMPSTHSFGNIPHVDICSSNHPHCMTSVYWTDHVYIRRALWCYLWL